MNHRGSDVLASMIAASHLLHPDGIPAMLAQHGRFLGASDVTLYLVDHEQRALCPLSGAPSGETAELSIDGTVAGRAFRTITVQDVPSADGGFRRWQPVVDGTERLGVLAVDFPPGAVGEADEALAGVAGVVALLVVTKRVYGDHLERTRRRSPMSLAAELAWQQLPPLTFGSQRVVISAALTPAYELGGDAFDYAVDDATARFAVFDAMGHGLPAGIMSTIAVAAYRNARRRGSSLSETVGLVDRAIATHVGDAFYVTAVLAELDLDAGRLRWCTAGHPRPLILRAGRIVRTLEGSAGVPLGLGTRPVVGEESLQPGDRVLMYTDGLVEARSESGELFGLERFADLVSRASSERTLPPEMLRRLMHAVVDHQFGSLRDDATALVVQWPGHGAEDLTV